MAFIKPADGVVFAEIDLENAFNSLTENSPLKKSIDRVINNLKENIFSGEKIRNELIPKEYVKKYKINNLWWYPLSKGWRLVYSIVNPNDIEILAVIIEYFSHKDYERRFGYYLNPFPTASPIFPYPSFFKSLTIPRLISPINDGPSYIIPVTS